MQSRAQSVKALGATLLFITPSMPDLAGQLLAADTRGRAKRHTKLLARHQRASAKEHLQRIQNSRIQEATGDLKGHRSENAKNLLRQRRSR